MGADNIDYIKLIVYEMWTVEFGMKKITLPSLVECTKEIECYTYQGYYLRLDQFRFSPDREPTLVIECASTTTEAQKNTFEDAFLYDTAKPIEEIIAEMKSDLPSI